jgi:ELWxxDGT repeat protein
VTQLSALGTRVFFTVFGSPSELWQSDGTPEGSSRLSPLDGTPVALTAFRDEMLFLVRDDVSGAATLWKSDGRAEGTAAVQTIPGGRVDRASVAEVGDRLLLLLVGTDGVELWRTDGSAGGAARVKDFGPAAIVSEPVRRGAELLFALDGQVWRSDGTADGTRRASVDLALRTPFPSLVPTLTLAGETLFTACEEETTGVELCAVPLAALCGGDCSGNGAVTVDELVTGVAIALGGQPLSHCRFIDTDRDGRVGISELVTAVQQALTGC